LLLRPLGLNPERPRDEPQQRWETTFDWLCDAFSREGLFEPRRGAGRWNKSRDAARRRYPGTLLTRDVLVHTWDLARAVGGR
jgi:hypothetical protein